MKDSNGARTAVDFDLVAVGYFGGRARNRHYGRDTQHPSCYRGVGDHAAALDNEPRGAEHQW